MSGMPSTESPKQGPLMDNSRALKLQTDIPHLVNIGGDRLSTSVTLHPIPPGRVTVGCGPGVDIPMHGTGVLPVHCRIENSEGVVTLYPMSDNTQIDGLAINQPTRLSQGVMLTIGRSNYLRFNHPAEAKLIKSVLPNPRISVAPLHFRPPVAPKPHSSRESLLGEAGVEEPPPSSIQTKVSKFEYLAQQNFRQSISPKVFTANSVTVNTPAKDVLGRSPPDWQPYSKHLPQNALNYSELNGDGDGARKIDYRPIFGKKSPQYVNVTVEAGGPKVINNRVVIYENGCVPKSHNVNFDHNELNNKASSCAKNINLSKANGRSVTPSPAGSRPEGGGRRSGSMGELDGIGSEVRRNQAQQERIVEQEIGRAEQARLEEILNMCVEYEKQTQIEKNKITPNRIKTNGSLPRDKRQYGGLSPSYTTPPPSPSFSQQSFHSYENTSYQQRSGERMNGNYDNIENYQQKGELSTSPYENIQLQQGGSSTPIAHSPRTRIRTIPSSNSRENCSKEPSEIIENKFAVLETPQPPHSPAKFILPLADAAAPRAPNPKKIAKLKSERRALLDRLSADKRTLAELALLEEEAARGADLERALLAGEAKCKQLEAAKLGAQRGALAGYGLEVAEKMRATRERQERDQLECRRRLEEAHLRLGQVEGRLAAAAKGSERYERVFEELLRAQDEYENERKVFEDLEFHYLEKEADALATREEVQREVADLSQKVIILEEQITELDTQGDTIERAALAETKNVQNRQADLLAKLEMDAKLLKRIETELALFPSAESDQDDSTDSDASVQLFGRMQQMNASNIIHDMSCSVVVVGDAKLGAEHAYNMSQSFSEKLLQEKAVLESGRWPSQDDIDRFSKVTLNAPIEVGGETTGVGRKTIESLRDIERKRRLHLCQQGSQVIEQERQRVFELKQRVQEEVRSEWAQRRLDCESMGESEEDETSKTITQQKTENELNTPKQIEIRPTSFDSDSRPMSEMSETSVEVGRLNGENRRRTRIGDKQRPLTRYLPIRGSDLDLKQHIESAGHQVLACPHVLISAATCRGFLHKKGAKLNGWSKRWFVFDRNKHTFTYYNDKSEKKARGGAYFQAIEEVYLDHLNNVKSPNPQLTFIVKTHERFYYLLAPSPEAMRIWVDVIFTGAEGYREFDIGT